MTALTEASDATLAERLGVPAAGHPTLADRAFGMLHDAIVRGALRPGERLLIDDLGKAMGMSPLPIREALSRLDAAGLVENIPYRGARVTEPSVEDLREIYDARLLLEVPAIERAAESFGAEDRSHAEQWLDRLGAALEQADSVAALKAHTGFHFALYRAPSSRWLVRLISPLWDSAERYLALASEDPGELLRSRMDDHERLLAACRDNDPGTAGAELWNHLTATVKVIADGMGRAHRSESRPLPA